MSRLRGFFLGGLVGGLLSVVLAPRLGRFRRGPLSGLNARVLDSFAGTPCSGGSAGGADGCAED